MSAALMKGAEAVGAKVAITEQHPMVRQHKDSIQFEMLGYTWEQMQQYLKDVQARGVPVAVFGPPGGGLARDYRSWRCAHVNKIRDRTKKIGCFGLNMYFYVKQISFILR